MSRHTTNPDSWDNSHPFNPANMEDNYEAPERHCFDCKRIEEEQVVGELHDNGNSDLCCDDCLLENGEACGDKCGAYWDAYLRKAKVTSATEGENSAHRRVMNAIDIIDHANRRLDTFSGPRSKHFRRIDTMWHFLTTYGYHERREEEREQAIASAGFALNTLKKTFTPNTLRK